MTDNRYSGNNNDSQPYVVGILSPSTTLFIGDATSENGNVAPPTDLQLERRSTTSFQITSVTVQGSRRNDDNAYDSCDDLDESHTDDLSSDILDSSRADGEGYHSEDNLDDLASPCGQQIIFQLPNNAVDRNMNLSIGVTPTFAAISPVAGGVTMMTSKSESPISAQVPIMNPLPNNWQRRFKVVKIISSEPFKRGRWLCMDFKDPPTESEPVNKPENNGRCTPPTIQITNCDPEAPPEGYITMDNLAQVYEIPINQSFRGNFIMGSQQHMYGIILPQNEYLQPVTLVEDVSLQTANVDRNFNNLVNRQSILVQSDPHSHPLPYATQAMHQQAQMAMVVNHGGSIPSHSPPQTQVLVNNYAGMPPEVVRNHIAMGGGNMNCDTVMPSVMQRSRNNSGANRIMPGHINNPNVRMDTDEIESFSSLDNELSQTSGLLPRNVPPPTIGANGHYCPPFVSSLDANLPQRAVNAVLRTPNNFATPCRPNASTVTNILPKVNHVTSAVAVVIKPAVNPPYVTDVNSSHTAPEKHPSEVGQEVEPSAGSAVPTGANTVAIDNKIEQAMDLVKSHLMFAVREEVEVLKEKITELLERISQLEHENDILRANASAETLKQLNTHKKSVCGGQKAPLSAIPPSST